MFNLCIYTTFMHVQKFSNNSSMFRCYKWIIGHRRVGLITDFKSSKIWGYKEKNGPDKWVNLGEEYAIAGKGIKQSPIDIISAQTKQSASILKLNNADLKMTGVLTNNGRSLEYMPTGEVPMLNMIGDFPNDGTNLNFKLLQFHFHWGMLGKEGSEHSIDNIRSEAEVHFVFLNTKFSEFKEAVKSCEGVLVIGFLLSTNLVSNFNQIFEAVSKDNLIALGNCIEGVRVKLSEIIQNTDKPNLSQTFYLYEGSLTTPITYECVLWCVAEERLGISEEQIALMRASIDEECDCIQQNHRPIQKLNDRVIKKIGK